MFDREKKRKSQQEWAYDEKHRLEIKDKVLRHYGHGEVACVSCGYTDMRALSIDHINGGGHQHRLTAVGSNTYRWLLKYNLPEGYQTLCMNCQFIKRYESRELRRNKPKPQ